MSSTDTVSDFLVIGAGIAGASIAARLAEHGTVRILEAEAQPGYHTTGRSAGMYLEIDRHASLRALIRASFDFLASPPPRFADGPLLAERGVLFIARAEQVASLDRFIAEHLSVPGDAVRGDRRLAQQHHPGLCTGTIAACLWHPGAREIDVHALLQGYLRKVREHGGALHTDARIESLRREGTLWTVNTGGMTCRAPVVINAAGAWAERIGELAGAQRMGLVARRRSVCIVPAHGIEVSAWPMVGDVDDEFYFRPDAGNVLLSPSEATPAEAGDAQADDLAIARAVDWLEALTEVRVTHKIRHQWAGLRSFVDDGLPVVGYDERAEGFFWLAGQGGNGIQTSPALSQLAAAAVLGDGVPAALAAAEIDSHTFSPQRLAPS